VHIRRKILVLTFFGLFLKYCFISGQLSPAYRLGEVKVTEASLIIAISSPHRKEALEVQYLLKNLNDVLKGYRFQLKWYLHSTFYPTKTDK
jgi:hypothetical protein